MTYAVTRDFPVPLSDPSGCYRGDDGGRYRIDDEGFEPRSEVGEYQGAIRTDGKVGGRVELRDINDVNSATVDGRSNVQIHVGGTYTKSEGERLTTGSLGCFTLSGDNKGNIGRDAFVGDITNRVKANVEAGKGGIIIITIQRRDEKRDFNQ